MSDIVERLRFQSEDHECFVGEFDGMCIDLITAAAEIESLRAELAKCQWQPIETAPKDEDVWFISYNGEEVVPAAFWECGFADVFMNWMEPQPTHWMPLPQPPKGKS